MTFVCLTNVLHWKRFATGNVKLENDQKIPKMCLLFWCQFSKECAPQFATYYLTSPLIIPFLHFSKIFLGLVTTGSTFLLPVPSHHPLPLPCTSVSRKTPSWPSSPWPLCVQPFEEWPNLIWTPNFGCWVWGGDPPHPKIHLTKIQRWSIYYLIHFIPINDLATWSPRSCHCHLVYQSWHFIFFLFLTPQNSINTKN